MPRIGTAEHPAAPAAAWKEPTRLAAMWRAFKVAGHIALRAAQNLLAAPKRATPGQVLAGAPVLAEHRSPLWVDGRADEFILRCGKAQNLRAAIRHFDGIEVAPGQVLSFWAQVGRPSRLRGFAVGREIVNGCVVPTVGGGLCQLSNALAALVAAMGAQLLERHRHSARIEQQGPTSDDATVAWNYVDLRFVADFAFRIEAELTADELVLRVRSHRGSAPQGRTTTWPLVRDERAVRPEPATARGCLTCDQTSCFRHKPRPKPIAGRRALLLNDRQPELARWLEPLAAEADWMLPWVRPALRARAWQAPAGASVTTAWWPSWKRIARQRLTRGEGGRRQAGRTRVAHDLARSYAQRLRLDHTELVLTQDLLVPLWRLGVLGGRTFDVFVPELPASEIQRRLDAAAAATPQATSLIDFRVDEAWLRDEWKALAGARRLLTAHHEVHRVLSVAGMNVDLLPWDEPPASPLAPRSPGDKPTLTLAGSALARKGAGEVAQVAKALGARVQILGSPPSDLKAWEGVDWVAVGYSEDWLARSDVVVLPAYVEHQPRALLTALAAGVPVVASVACGLGTRAGLAEVVAGDFQALKQALVASLGRTTAHEVTHFV
jgi:hypothetical protein